MPGLAADQRGAPGLGVCAGAPLPVRGSAVIKGAINCQE